MAVELKGSKTRENLMKAFAGESQARNRYTMAAEILEKQGYQALAQIFLFTADQERAHAERFYDLLKGMKGTTIEICGGYPVDPLDGVKELLASAKHNEMEEFEVVYPAFARQAREEGFVEIASAFLQIAQIEEIHGKRFARIAELLADGKWFEAAESSEWMCLNCGYIHKGKRTPQNCPVCRYERGYFIPAELAPYLDGSL